MTLKELQQQVLKLPKHDQWQLVQAVLKSLEQETSSPMKPKNLSRLRGIAKGVATSENADGTDNYVNYLTQKYQ
jgi:hypothetical protein